MLDQAVAHPIANARYYGLDVVIGWPQFLVAWLDERAGPGSLAVYATRVLDDGTVVDVDGSLIYSFPAGHEAYFPPSVASDGSQFLVVWEDQTGSWPPEADIYGALIPGDGSAPSAPILMGNQNTQQGPVVASDGNQFLVAWAETSRDPTTFQRLYVGIGATRVQTDGVVLDVPGIAADNDPVVFSVAASPSNGTLGSITQLSDTTAEVVYTPSQDWNGVDTFTFVAELAEQSGHKVERRQLLVCADRAVRALDGVW